MEIDMTERTDRASQACLACRRQKRRCDKQLPICSLCNRTSRQFDYSEAPPNPTSEDIASMKQRIADLEERLQAGKSDSGHSPLQFINKSPDKCVNPPFAENGRSSLLAAFFLDAEVFEDANLKVGRPNVSVPAEVAAVLGSSILDIQDVVDLYFANIHNWLPIISKKRMAMALCNPALEMTVDLALLLLAMKLITQLPSCGPQGALSLLYSLTKNYYTMVESLGVVSIQVLQADVLIAAYEIGHAIYPAAYLTTGHCARLGHMLGLHDRLKAPQLLKRKPAAWAEAEETKRVWWAVMLLDRYANLGARSHPLATSDPARNEALPADDDMWDEGELNGGEPLYVSSLTQVKAGSFARTCQTTHLMGRLICILNDRLLDSPPRFSEAIQLHKTLRALGNLLPGDVHNAPERYGTALALCYSSLMHLSDPFACTESRHGPHSPEETEMQNLAIASYKPLAAEVLEFSEILHIHILANPSATSPFIGDCLYFGGTIYAWLAFETGQKDMADAYRTIRSVLESMSARWAVAHEYLALLDISKENSYPDSSLI